MLAHAVTARRVPAVARRVKELRKRRGRSAQRLAEVCAATGSPQLSESVIANIESGCRDEHGRRRRDVTVDEVIGLAAALDMPAIHLLEHMRSRFGFREGQFPVAEDASARLLALPFFPTLAESQIDRVCDALAEALRGDWT